MRDNGHDLLALGDVVDDRPAPAASTGKTWIATPDKPDHLGPEPAAIMVAQTRAAAGPSGPNVEYVVRLADALRALGIHDPHVDALARAFGV